MTQEEKENPINKLIPHNETLSILLYYFTLLIIINNIFLNFLQLLNSRRENY